MFASRLTTLTFKGARAKIVNNDTMNAHRASRPEGANIPIALKKGTVVQLLGGPVQTSRGFCKGAMHVQLVVLGVGKHAGRHMHYPLDALKFIK